LRELLHGDFHDFTGIERQLTGFDACFFALAISSVGMTEDAYRKTTVDITAAAGETLARRNPDKTFVFVSGAGSDSTEKGAVMWARVKGAAENLVLRLPMLAVARHGYSKRVLETADINQVR
jgi:hypothetical protein